MTLQTLNTAIAWPGITARTSVAPGISSGSLTLNAATDYDSFVICAREDMTISHVGVNIAASGSPTMDVRIETVDASGVPTGTLWNTNTNIVTGALSSGFTLHALTASASITKGQVFCVKFLYQSGTSVIPRTLTGVTPSANAFPYEYQFDASTGTKVAFAAATPIALGSSSTTFYSVRNFYPITTITNNAFNNTNGARRGLRFQVPFKCRCVGLRHFTNTNNGDYNAAIFDDAGSELASSSTAFDGDQSSNIATGNTDCYFDNPVTLSPATWYRAVIEPSSSTNTNITTFALPSSSYRSAMPHGSNALYTTYASAAWTDTATDTLPYMDILIDQLDDGVSAGGSQRVYGA